MGVVVEQLVIGTAHVWGAIGIDDCWVALGGGGDSLHTLQHVSFTVRYYAFIPGKIVCVSLTADVRCSG